MSIISKALRICCVILLWHALGLPYDLSVVLQGEEFAINFALLVNIYILIALA